MKNKSRTLFIVISALLTVCLIVAAFLIGKSFSGSSDNDVPLDYSDIMQSIDYGDVTYVIGHKSPDTDTVVSAITYAALKNQLGVNCIPVVSGKINNETKFVLEYFKVPVPEILDYAAGKHMILVDHSTYTQTIDGMSDAHIAEILDHHGLGDVTTAYPLYIKDMAVGSTATIVYTSYIENGKAFDEATAGLLVSAILSDTNNLTSVTTTDADRKACAYLASVARLSDLNAYYVEMREYAENYEGMSDAEIFYSDYKEYEMNGISVGIACVNAAEGQETAMCSRMNAYMKEYYEKQDMRHLYVLVYNAYNDRSVLLHYGDRTDDIIQAAFGEITDENGNTVFHPSASRKKDVVPPLEKAYSIWQGEARAQ